MRLENESRWHAIFLSWASLKKEKRQEIFSLVVLPTKIRLLITVAIDSDFWNCSWVMDFSIRTATIRSMMYQFSLYWYWLSCDIYPIDDSSSLYNKIPRPLKICFRHNGFAHYNVNWNYLRLDVCRLIVNINRQKTDTKCIFLSPFLYQN